MQKSPKKVGLPKNLVNFKKSSKEVTKKSLAKTPTKKSTTSPKGMKTLMKTLMAGFQTEGQTKTALGMPLKDLSESAVGLLISHYKVDNEKVLSTTALAM